MGPTPYDQSRSVYDQSRVGWRRLALVVVGAVMAFMPLGCAHPELSTPAIVAVNHVPKHLVMIGGGMLTAPSPTATAVTYNPDLAPTGAVVTAALTVTRLPDGSTRALLTVIGLLPHRGYAAHAHTNACGVTGADAGPHFQHHRDPAATPQQPSVDPRYANPSNEVWLDVRTNASGAGTSRATVPFTFTDRVPGSIVIHEAMQTATGQGEAGKAGARIACLTLSGR